MPASRARKLFVIHTKSDDVHKRLFNGLLETFDGAGLSVWQYFDWDWREYLTERDTRFSEEAVELMSAVDKEVFGVREPRQVEGDVDRETLDSLVLDAPAVLIFEFNSDITPGVQEEVEIVDTVFDRLFPFGHFALVDLGTDGYFARRYPLHYGAVLQLDVSGGVQQRTVEQLALFGLRVLVRKEMISQLWLGEPSGEAVEALGDWVSKTARLIASCEVMTLIRPDMQVVELVEEILSWTLCLVRRFDPETIWNQIPNVANWITSRFDHACRHTDLREEGLLNLISVLRALEARGTEMLTEIQRRPLYRESKKVKAVSGMAIVESSRGLQVEGRTVVESLIETATSGNVSDDMRSTLLRRVGNLAEREDPPMRHRAAELIRNLVEHGSLDESAIGACLSAFGRVGKDSDAPWLLALLNQDLPEPVQLKALLALMEIIGSEAEDLVLGFLTDVGPAARCTIGSASWRIDKDRLYDALLQTDPDDEKMRAVVLHALTSAGNARAWVQAVQDISSASPYLRALAILYVPEIVNRYQPSHTQVEQLAVRLRGLLDDESEMVRFGAIAALVRLSQQEYFSHADDLLRQLLRKGCTKFARTLLVDGGLGLAEWPADREVRLLLFHPSPDIRGAMVFIAGHQKRHRFAKELRMLQGDLSDITPFYSDKAMKDIGKTVQECAELALGRISGSVAAVDTGTW